MTEITNPLSKSLMESGWRAHDLPGLLGVLGPLLTRRDGDQWAYAIRVRDEHLNQAQVVHGGTITALMDHALSTIAWDRAGRVPCVTVQLNVNFLGTSRAGQLLVARGKVSHEAGSLLFLDGTLHADDILVSTAQAIMKRLEKRD
ncbi:PaaI family thioesterase [Pollutimonas subterranea]|uniref:PaaI family thioesterase n=1 Tax=Pollutimonas subterranea TaxID=2045210 RepID=UPI001E440DDF|nr:PaaI family thioesterase [Pollutimonas subterranea]